MTCTLHCRLRPSLIGLLSPLCHLSPFSWRFRPPLTLKVFKPLSLRRIRLPHDSSPTSLFYQSLILSSGISRNSWYRFLNPKFSFFLYNFQTICLNHLSPHVKLFQNANSMFLDTSFFGLTSLLLFKKKRVIRYDLYHYRSWSPIFILIYFYLSFNIYFIGTESLSNTTHFTSLFLFKFDVGYKDWTHGLL